MIADVDDVTNRNDDFCMFLSAKTGERGAGTLRVDGL